jgi:hypothetical protein
MTYSNGIFDDSSADFHARESEIAEDEAAAEQERCNRLADADADEWRLAQVARQERE